MKNWKPNTQFYGFFLVDIHVQSPAGAMLQTSDSANHQASFLSLPKTDI